MAQQSSTKRLARQLGLLRRSSSTLPSQQKRTDTNRKRINKNEQIFGYLVVLDFESTCWEDKENRYSPEIIEFPAVLVNLATAEIEDKFHYYIQPTEHGKLSPFCIELTGIKQDMVDNGIPIGVCLKLFTDWLHKHIFEKNIFFPSISKPSGYHKVIFVTWSDWDLNTCLQYECKRKRINYSPYLKSWIDLRKTYQVFYDRKPKGLNGALKDVGITFQGREHSGIDDAINTAYLAIRMLKDGCILKATKSLILSMDVCNRYEILSLSVMNQVGDLNCIKTSVDSNTVNDKEQLITTKHNCILECKSNKPNHIQICTESSSDKGSGSNPKLIQKLHNVLLKSYCNNNGVHVETNRAVQDKKTLDIPQGKKQFGTKIIGISKRTPIGLDKHHSLSSNKLTVTPPLCECGKRCKRKKVVNPGPNTGRVFYSCPGQRLGVQASNTCKYFQWEKNVAKSSYLTKQSTEKLCALTTPLGMVQKDICGSIIKQTNLKNQYKCLFNVSSSIVS